jgi:toxin secretion/phage lysis holin
MDEFVKSLIGEHPVWKSVFGVLMSLVTFLLGPWDVLLYILGTLFILDWITGLIAAFVEKALSSKEGLKRIPRKVGMIVAISLCHFADVALGTQTFFRDAGLYFYMANEVLSIIENLRRAGVPIPPPLERALDLIQEKSEGGDRHV